MEFLRVGPIGFFGRRKTLLALGILKSCTQHAAKVYVPLLMEFSRPGSSTFPMSFGLVWNSLEAASFCRKGLDDWVHDEDMQNTQQRVHLSRSFDDVV